MLLNDMRDEDLLQAWVETTKSSSPEAADMLKREILKRMSDGERTPFEPIRHVSHRLGVPDAWLKKQVLSGLVPRLMCGKAILVNMRQVKESLLKMQIREAPPT